MGSPAVVYHITSASAWNDALSLGELRAPSLATEGFIHFSTAVQVERSLRKFFAGVDEVLLLHISAEAVAEDLRYEPADEQLFPHLYAPLPVAAVLRTEPITRASGEEWRVSLEERQ